MTLDNSCPCTLCHESSPSLPMLPTQFRYRLESIFDRRRRFLTAKAEWEEYRNDELYMTSEELEEKYGTPFPIGPLRKNSFPCTPVSTLPGSRDLNAPVTLPFREQDRSGLFSQWKLLAPEKRKISPMPTLKRISPFITHDDDALPPRERLNLYRASELETHLRAKLSTNEERLARERRRCAELDAIIASQEEGYARGERLLAAFEEKLRMDREWDDVGADVLKEEAYAVEGNPEDGYHEVYADWECHIDEGEGPTEKWGTSDKWYATRGHDHAEDWETCSEESFVKGDWSGGREDQNPNDHYSNEKHTNEDYPNEDYPEEDYLDVEVEDQPSKVEKYQKEDYVKTWNSEASSHCLESWNERIIIPSWKDDWATQPGSVWYEPIEVSSEEDEWTIQPTTVWDEPIEAPSREDQAENSESNAVDAELEGFVDVGIDQFSDFAHGSGSDSDAVDDEYQDLVFCL